MGLEFNGDFECFEFDWLLSQMEIFSNFTSPREKGLEIELQNLNLGLGFGFFGLFFAGGSSDTLVVGGKSGIVCFCVTLNLCLSRFRWGPTDLYVGGCSYEWWGEHWL